MRATRHNESGPRTTWLEVPLRAEMTAVRGLLASGTPSHAEARRTCVKLPSRRSGRRRQGALGTRPNTRRRRCGSPDVVTVHAQVAVVHDVAVVTMQADRGQHWRGRRSRTLELLVTRHDLFAVAHAAVGITRAGLRLGRQQAARGNEENGKCSE